MTNNTITLTREEAQQVLDALDKVFDHNDWQSYETAVYLLRARLAQETPYEIGKRLYQEGKGISFIPTAVERDDQIGEALRGFEDARLEQPEPDYRDVVIKGDLWRIEFLPDHAASVVLVRANYEAQPEPEPVADKYLMEVECTKCGAKQDGILTVNVPPQRNWQGLTDEEIYACSDTPWTPTGLKCIRAIEAKLKEKNA